MNIPPQIKINMLRQQLGPSVPQETLEKIVSLEVPELIKMLGQLEQAQVVLQEGGDLASFYKSSGLQAGTLEVLKLMLQPAQKLQEEQEKARNFLGYSKEAIKLPDNASQFKRQIVEISREIQASNRAVHQLKASQLRTAQNPQEQELARSLIEIAKTTQKEFPVIVNILVDIDAINNVSDLDLEVRFALGRAIVHAYGRGLEVSDFRRAEQVVSSLKACTGDLPLEKLASSISSGLLEFDDPNGDRFAEIGPAFEKFLDDESATDLAYRNQLAKAIISLLNDRNSLPYAELLDEYIHYYKLSSKSANQEQLLQKRLAILQKLSPYFDSQFLVEHFNNEIDYLPIVYNPFTYSKLDLPSLVRSVIDFGQGLALLTELRGLSLIKPKHGEILENMISSDIQIRLLDTVLRYAPAEICREIVSGALAKFDTNGFRQDFKASNALWAARYSELVSCFDKKVNLLKEPGRVNNLYRLMAADFMTQYHGLSSKDLDFNHRLAKIAKFFVLNPQRKLVKDAIAYWAGNALIDQQAAASLTWIVDQLKDSLGSRDAYRKIHNYILRMVFHNAQGESQLSEFMSKLAMIRKVEDKELRKKDIAAFLDMSSLFISSASAAKIKHSIVMNQSLSAAQEITAKKYRDLQRKYQALLVDDLFEAPVSLTPSKATIIKKHILDNPDAWNRQNLFMALLRYYQFQNNQGKQAVEDYMHLLASSQTVETQDGEHLFKQVPRYAYDGLMSSSISDDLKQTLEDGISFDVSAELADKLGAKHVSLDISTDPADLVFYPMRPQANCLRISEPTNFNQKGQSLVYARRGQFAVLNLVVDDKVNKSSIIEFAKIMSVNERNNLALLVNQMSQEGSISKEEFKTLIQKAALKLRKKHPEISSLAFTDIELDMNDTAVVKKPINSFEAYSEMFRDITWRGRYPVIDLAELQISFS